MSPGESSRRHKHPLVTSTARVDPAGEKTLDLTKGGFERSGSNKPAACRIVKVISDADRGDLHFATCNTDFAFRIFD